MLALIFFLLAFANNWLDFIWHGMHFPDSLPGRQSFLYMFVLLTMAFEELRRLKENRIWHVVVAAVACGAFFVCCALFVDHEMVSMDAILMTAVFLLAYTLLLAIARMAGAYRKICFLYGILSCGCGNRGQHGSDRGSYDKPYPVHGTLGGL